MVLLILNKIFILIIIFTLKLCHGGVGEISIDNAKNIEKCEKTENGKLLNKIRNLMQGHNLLELSGSRPIPLQEDYINAIIVPMNDAHLSEYVGERDLRIRFVSGFTGSAGQVLITNDSALLWTDSRYHLQAENELNLDCWKIMKSGLLDVPTLGTWISNNLPNNSRIGYDPFLLSTSSYRNIHTDMNNFNRTYELVGMKENLIDKVWKNRPQFPRNTIKALSLNFTGKPAGKKISQIREKILQKGAQSIVITALDEIAWLLNLRGSDIPFNPVFYSYIVLTQKDLHWFVDDRQISNEVLKQLDDEFVIYQIENYKDILHKLEVILENNTDKVLISEEINFGIYQSILDDRKIISKSLIADIKSVKNNVEAVNIEKAHIRDGFALIRYFHWLNETIDNYEVTELTGADQLEKFRSELENYRGLSFSTVSSVGPNAAMAHYSPTKESAKRIARKYIYLCDSGGQYLDGTTDVTRTVHFGNPTETEKELFTRVLKGFIGFLTSVFPPNTPLNKFDYIARRYLWQVGLDYGHGTGHGVGAYGLVHEYPPLVHGKSETIALENMFMSDEPGYYRDGYFGFRIEDVIQVVKANLENDFNGRGALKFKSVTYAHIQTKMIAKNLLCNDEIDYINKYNKRVIDTIGPMLRKADLIDTYEWLIYDARPLV